MRSMTSDSATTRSGEWTHSTQDTDRVHADDDSEKDLQRQVKTVKDQLRDLHTSNESTQAKLLDASQRQGQP
jgi:hypothetical protein